MHPQRATWCPQRPVGGGLWSGECMGSMCRALVRSPGPCAAPWGSCVDHAGYAYLAHQHICT